MIVHRTRFITIGEVLFGAPIGEGRVDVVHHLQRSTPLQGATCTPFKTIHLHLVQDEAALLAGVKKGTRYDIRRAETDGVTCHVESATALDAFEAFFARFSAAKQITAPARAQLEAYARAGVLDLSRAADASGETLVWHAHLVSAGRARLWLSATHVRDDDDRARATLIGRANRLLHWRDVLRFRAAGCTVYDLGGWEGDSPVPELRGISRFKEEFGGQVVEEITCVEAVTLRGRAYRAAERLIAQRRRGSPDHLPRISPRSLLCCPEDGAALSDVQAGLRCDQCARVYPIEDGIVRFVTALDSELKHSEMQARDNEAEAYEARFSSLRNAIEMPPSLAALAPNPGDRVAELGCGSGRMTLAYLDQVACVIALDFSFASLRVLSRKLSPAQRERVVLVQADICKPPIRRGAVTKVASFQVFEHLPTVELRTAAARAAGELLAAGGTFLVTVYNWNRNKQRLAKRGVGDNTAKEGFHAGSHRIYYFNFERRDVEQLLDAAGVQLVALRGLDAQFRGIDLVGRLAIPVNRVLERLPLGRSLGHLLLAAGEKP